MTASWSLPPNYAWVNLLIADSMLSTGWWQVSSLTSCSGACHFMANTLISVLQRQWMKTLLMDGLSLACRGYFGEIMDGVQLHKNCASDLLTLFHSAKHIRSGSADILHSWAICAWKVQSIPNNTNTVPNFSNVSDTGIWLLRPVLSIFLSATGTFNRRLDCYNKGII